MEKIKKIINSILRGIGIFFVVMIVFVMLLPSPKNNVSDKAEEALLEETETIKPKNNLEAEIKRSKKEENSEEQKLSQKEEMYIEFMLANISELRGNLEVFIVLFDNPLFTEDWMTVFLANNEGLEEIKDEAISYENIPIRFKKTHDLYVLSLESYSKAYKTFEEAIENFDSKKMDEGAELIALGNEYLNTATTLINEMNNN